MEKIILDRLKEKLETIRERKKKLVWWAILSHTYMWTIHSLWALLFASLFFYSFEQVWKHWFVPLMSVVLPVIILESIAGGYIGYKIWQRVNKIL